MENQFFDIVQKLKLEHELLRGNFGLEKENVRVNEFGELALTPHPAVFGNKLTHPFITTDFSESQIEMITPMFHTLEECFNFLENIHHIITLELKEEYLWPQSNPPMLPEEEQIPIAKYENSIKGKEAEQYREKLAAGYGKKKQMISGIHYNFSLQEEFLNKIYKEADTNKTYKQFKNDIYLQISRHILQYRWLLIYLFGASPGVHTSYNKECIEIMEKLDQESSYFQYASSFRNGVCGYRNEGELIVSYRTVDEYVSDIKKLIKNGKLQSAKEYYSPVRLKSNNNSDLLTSLESEGIEYLELRILDLNPFLNIGVDLETLYFVHLFILFGLYKKEVNKNEHSQMTSLINHELAASLGRKQNLMLFKTVQEVVSIHKWGIEILDEMLTFVSKLGIRKDYFQQIIYDAKHKFNHPEKGTSSLILEGIREKSFIQFHMEKAKQYLNKSKTKSYNLLGYEDMELSTQILLKDAIKKGIHFEILDRNDNFILLKNGSKKEYIKQATKTSLDSYSTIQVMGNKLVTKKVLNEQGIHVPMGQHYLTKDEALSNYLYFKKMEIVTKPKSTNFGLGISILRGDYSQASFERSVELAFQYDDSILIEQFINGKEYRFFVIQDEVVGILHRVPANVTGNGQSNIQKLVEEKNKNPLRGKGYRTPLEKIKLSENEEMFLRGQGLNFQSIPKMGEIVYLRENSNISTGGDSIDFTDVIHSSYKNVAVSAAQTVGASICGVDMIIKDDYSQYVEENYSIIELNFNPAIHIHCYPFKGENRKLGEKILEALRF
ncbi:bifunctional glutamate--cysteine ligase GshA/glutathione synthetase GshB [Chengkuizengella sediminis]|uniref:bifunctional glutamate--cysteine ligase GshA/glutathione synthetase GshB n=1 Tax=Chengkuizengella sediminis TaxID=1885917 RepID=UPI0013895B58|nr:bifunctional glutamate--cysteine ligase GshA/glutathione synthetase GshB [Chengkuizengella sediminis]